LSAEETPLIPGRDGDGSDREIFVEIMGVPRMTRLRLGILPPPRVQHTEALVETPYLVPHTNDNQQRSVFGKFTVKTTFVSSFHDGVKRLCLLPFLLS